MWLLSNSIITIAAPTPAVIICSSNTQTRHNLVIIRPIIANTATHRAVGGAGVSKRVRRRRRYFRVIITGPCHVRGPPSHPAMMPSRVTSFRWRHAGVARRRLTVKHVRCSWEPPIRLKTDRGAFIGRNWSRSGPCRRL